MVELNDLRCSRHPDRPGEWGITTHYLANDNWRDSLKAEQVFGPLCGECRLDFIHWQTTPAHIGA